MAVESGFTVPDGIDFRGAIAITQSLLDDIEQGSITAEAVEKTIAALVHSEDGARGFFVTYLSDDRPLADHPTPAIVTALQSSPTIVSPLLVKNLAMSTAMAIAHQRNQDEALAQGSDRVRSRTAQLIQQLQLPQVETEVRALLLAIETGEGDYQRFLSRWGYDVEQQRAIGQTMGEMGVGSRE